MKDLLNGAMAKEPLFVLLPVAFVVAALIAVLFHVTGTPIQGVKEVAMLFGGLLAFTLTARTKVTSPASVDALVKDVSEAATTTALRRAAREQDKAGLQ